MDTESQCPATERCRQAESPLTRPKGRGWTIWCSAALAGAVMALFFLLNHLQPMSLDDYAYSFIWGENTRVASIPDMLRSVWYEWNLFTGRIVANIIMESFLMFDKSVFNIANTLCLLGLAIAMVYFTCDWTKPGKAVAVASVMALFVLTVPAAADTLLWLAGSCNYLWVMLIVVLFLLAFFSEKRSCQLLALFLAPWAGNANEGLAIGLIGLLALHTLLTWKKGHGSLYYITIVLTVAAFALRMASPGIHARMGKEMQLDGMEVSFLSVMLDNLGRFFHLLSISVVRTTSVLSLVILALGVLIFKFRKCRQLDERTLLIFKLLAAASLQALALICVGSFTSRAWSGVYLYLFLASLSCLLPLIQRCYHSWGMGLAVLSSALACFVMVRSLPAARLNKELWARTMADVKAEKHLIDNYRELGIEQYGIDIGKQRFAFDGVRGYPYCNMYSTAIAAYYGSEPFGIVTRRQKALIDSIGQDDIGKALDGNIVMLPGGRVFLATPPNTAHIKVWRFPAVESDDKGGTHSVGWPIGSMYGIIFPVGEDKTAFSVTFSYLGRETSTLSVSSEQLQELRSNGILPIERATRH